MSLEPVIIRVTRDHAYVKTKRGCKVCGAAKTDPAHIGHSDSLNVLGSGNRFTYQAMKKGWTEALTLALGESGLQRGLQRVMVEGLMCFPTRTKRDQGNHRFIVEKALGDALTAGGWLEDDDWDRYSFGGLDCAYAKGESWTQLFLMPA